MKVAGLTLVELDAAVSEQSTLGIRVVVVGGSAITALISTAWDNGRG